MGRRRPKLSVVAPAYNEEECIESVILHWVRELRRLEPDYEIIICDDGSKDKTWSIIERLARTNKRIRNVRHMKNQGAGAAHTSALSCSSGQWVLMIDSDGQFDIGDYEVLKKEQARTAADAVIGARQIKEDSPFFRLGSAASGACANLLLGSRIADFNSVFKLVRGDLARGLHLEARRFDVSTDMTAKLLERGAKIAVHEIRHRPRTQGQSKLRFFRAAMSRLRFIRYLHTRRRLINAAIIQGNPPELARGVNWQ
jgi:dolichol-phosphate mannosyltransferase